MPRHCAECGYNLEGAAESGTCPECGQDFIPSTILRRGPITSRDLILRFGWPLAIYALSTYLVVSDSAPGYAGPLLIIAVAAFFACYANIIYQTWLLRRAGMRRRGTERMLNRNLMIWMLVATILTPLIVCGGILTRLVR